MAVSWGKYELWNTAIADVVFSTENAGMPVYLDLEDDLLAEVAKAAGDAPEDAADALAASVRATIDPAAPARRLLHAHSVRVGNWRRSRALTPPPHLALLALMSLAAEQMANGEGMSSTNYYGRLAPLLGLGARPADLAQAYRRVAESWWGALNHWLERNDGRRGLPTAYSLSEQQQRYVGLPISQALVRAGDRDALVRFFQRVGFPAGADVPPHALLPLLDAWISQTPSPATRSLQRIWSRRTARDRVAEVAAVALASWDGAVSKADPGDTRVDEVLRLVATVGGFLSQRLDVGVLAYLERPEEARTVRVTTADGHPAVTAVPTTAGAMRLAGIEHADLGSLLDGILRVEDTLTGRAVSRLPRRLVPLRRNELLQQLVEADQVQAGEDLTLLVDRGLLPQMEAMLGEVARPGWTLAGDELQGVPERWALVRDVQILRAPTATPDQDLTSLVPLTRSHMTLAGGFGIPGRLRRWHTWDPPEIRALDESDAPLTVRLIALASTGELGAEEGENVHLQRVVQQWVGDEPGSVFVSLSDAELDDGDYRVELLREGDGASRTSLVLRLRSGDEPDLLQWSVAPALGHAASDALGVLSAQTVSGPGAWLRGAVADQPTGGLPGNDVDVLLATPWWESAAVSRPASSTAWKVAAPDPSSCMFTGAHYLLVPEDRGGRPTSRFVSSTCRDCGLVKRVATTAWAARKRDVAASSVSTATPLDVRRVTPVRVDDIDRWGIAVDALSHLGGGDFSVLEKVALQVQGSALFVDQLVRTLELLGHIEVERDRESLRPIRWEVAPTCLAQASDGTWSLAGYWPGVLTEALGEVLTRAGGGVDVETTEEGPQRWFAHVPAGSLPDLSALEVEVTPAAASAVAAHLRPLSEVVAGLPRRSADVVGDVTAFSAPGARWVPVDGLGVPGGYRARRWTVLDLLQTADDVENHAAATSTVHLSKHFAALVHGRPLVAYDAAAQTLVVPLGADLPGLFGRAAVLASGRPPEVDPARRRLLYRAVPEDVAVTIAHCLSS